MPLSVEDVSTMTVDKLKSALKDMNLPFTGKKAELAARLIEHLSASDSVEPVVTLPMTLMTGAENSSDPMECSGSEEKLSAVECDTRTDVELSSSTTDTPVYPPVIDTEKQSADATKDSPAPSMIVETTSSLVGAVGQPSVVKNKSLLREKMLREQAMASLRNSAAASAASCLPATISVSVSQEPTRHVRVNHLLRPLAVQQLRLFLGELAGSAEHPVTVAETDLWVSPLKSHCYVSFASPEHATACKARISEGRSFPTDAPVPASGAVQLTCFYTTLAAVDIRAACAGDSRSAPGSTTALWRIEALTRPVEWERCALGQPATGSGSDRPVAAFVTRRNMGTGAQTGDNVVVLQSRVRGDVAQKRPREENENLVENKEPRRTHVQPRIYWQPVSAEVQEQRRARLRG